MKCLWHVFGGETWAVPVNTGVLMSLLPSCAIALCYLVLMSMLCTVCCVLCATVPSFQFHPTSYCATLILIQRCAASVKISHLTLTCANVSAPSPVSLHPSIPCSHTVGERTLYQLQVAACISFCWVIGGSV